MAMTKRASLVVGCIVLAPLACGSSDSGGGPPSDATNGDGAVPADVGGDSGVRDSTSSDAPLPDVGPADSGKVSSITKDGITWTFSSPVTAGQFVNGDWWIVGPATVSAIDPKPTNADPYLNGSVLNLPTKNGKSGFDSRLDDGSDESWWFDASFRSYPPIALKAGDALVSTISLATIHSLPEVMRSGDMSASPVRTASSAARCRFMSSVVYTSIVPLLVVSLGNCSVIC